MIEPGPRNAGADKSPAASLTSVVIRRDGDAGDRRQEPPLVRPERVISPPAGIEDARTQGVADRPQSLAEMAPLADFHAYWMGLKDETALPAWATLDQQLVLERWPNSIILMFPEGAERPRPDSDSPFARILRDAKAQHADHHPTEMTHSPQMTEWMLSLGQEAARRVRPVKDREVQPSLTGKVRFGAIALPFGGEDGCVERVLCHVWRERV